MLQEFTRGKRYGNIWERQSRSHREGNINKIWAVTYRVSTDTMCTITVNEWKVISILHFKDLRKSEGTVHNVEYPWIIHSNQPFQTHSLNNKMPVLKFWKKNNSLIHVSIMLTDIDTHFLFEHSFNRNKKIKYLWPGFSSLCFINCSDVRRQKCMYHFLQ